jgi:isopropylmalate/homocitrate/citramalate synthase
MHRLTRAFLQDGTDGVEICMHCHNDFGLAVANTLAGVTAGATAVTCTVNGIGERAGNADLAETAAALTFLHQVSHNVRPAGLEPVSRLVERVSGIHTSAIKPVTGFNVFRHESGVHVDGMLKEERSYQFLPPQWVGRAPEYVLGKHSGSALVRYLLDQAGIPHDEVFVQLVLARVKAATTRRDKRAYGRMLAQAHKFQRTALSGTDLQSVIAVLRQRCTEEEASWAERSVIK